MWAFSVNQPFEPAKNGSKCDEGEQGQFANHVEPGLKIDGARANEKKQDGDPKTGLFSEPGCGPAEAT